MLNDVKDAAPTLDSDPPLKDPVQRAEDLVGSFLDVLYPDNAPLKGLVTGFYKATETFRIDFVRSNALRIRMDMGLISDSVFESQKFNCKCEFHVTGEIKDSKQVTEYLVSNLRQQRHRKGKVGYMLGKIIKSDWGNDGVFLGVISEYAKGNRFRLVYMDGDDEWGVFLQEQDFKVFQLEDGGSRLIQWFDLNFKDLRAAGEDSTTTTTTTTTTVTTTHKKASIKSTQKTTIPKQTSTFVREDKKKISEIQNKKKNKNSAFSGAFASAFMESSKIEKDSSGSEPEDLITNKITEPLKDDEGMKVVETSHQGSAKRTLIEAEEEDLKPSPFKRTKHKEQIKLIQEQHPAGEDPTSKPQEVKDEDQKAPPPQPPQGSSSEEVKTEVITPRPQMSEISRSTSGSFSTSLTKASPRILSSSRKRLAYSSVEIGLEMQNLISDLEHLTQSKEKIVKATNTANAVAKYGGAKRVIDALFDQIREPVGEERRISLFYLCDSILQSAAKEKHKNEANQSTGETSLFLELVEGRLTELVEHLSEDYECYKKLKRVLILWKERKVLNSEPLDAALSKVEDLSSQHGRSIEDDEFKDQGKTVLYVRRADGPECSRMVLSKTFSSLGNLQEVMKLPEGLKDLTIRNYSRKDWDQIDGEIQQQGLVHVQPPGMSSRTRSHSRVRRSHLGPPPLPRYSPMDIDDPNFIPPLPPGSPPDEDPNFIPPLPSSPPPLGPKPRPYPPQAEFTAFSMGPRNCSPMNPWERHPPIGQGRYQPEPPYPNQPPLPRGNPPQSLPPHLVNHGYHYQPPWPPTRHQPHQNQGNYSMWHQHQKHW